MSLIENQDEFFKVYNINKEEFESASLNWSVLKEIYYDYLKKYPDFQSIANPIADLLRQDSNVHSVRSRIKNAEHLVEKIIRKTIKKRNNGDTSYEINPDNYQKEITDIIGIRVLHLYKDQAKEIDKLIRDKWELAEQPIIYYREGDSLENIDTKKFDTKKHPAGYRSWHYLIKTQPTKTENLVEIQVRTIFEEGWSEIDHQLRYPYELNNKLLNEQLLVLNRLAGSADEMVNTIRETHKSFRAITEENKKKDNLIEGLRKEIEILSEKYNIQKQEMKSIENKLKDLEKAQQHSSNFSLIGNIDIPSSIQIGGNIDIPSSFQISDLSSISFPIGDSAIPYRLKK
ncbi:hypothetical protein GT3570_17480 (plasmid) [Geobacillus thermoleovorans]|uniref:RelA/SpoT domain-containing protein n=1 Tax=Geobacillus thermoleovorans TaxID=33941 RepID=UPI00078C5830|nr:hypothetical protein GT3570_17480 [Geobacillus thermoleovorans]